TEHRTPRSPPGRTCETTIDPSDAEVQKNASGASGSGVDGTPGMPGAAEVETGVGLAEGLGVGLGVTAEVLAEGLAGTTATVDALGVGVAATRVERSPGTTAAPTARTRTAASRAPAAAQRDDRSSVRRRTRMSVGPSRVAGADPSIADSPSGSAGCPAGACPLPVATRHPPAGPRAPRPAATGIGKSGVAP